MNKLAAILAHCFTDAKMRPEIKLVLGVPILITAVVYGIVSKDWIGFAALAGTAGTLLGITAVTDAALDKIAAK